MQTLRQLQRVSLVAIDEALQLPDRPVLIWDRDTTRKQYQYCKENIMKPCDLVVARRVRKKAFLLAVRAVRSLSRLPL